MKEQNTSHNKKFTVPLRFTQVPEPKPGLAKVQELRKLGYVRRNDYERVIYNEKTS